MNKEKTGVWAKIDGKPLKPENREDQWPVLFDMRKKTAQKPATPGKASPFTDISAANGDGRECMHSMPSGQVADMSIAVRRMEPGPNGETHLYFDGYEQDPNCTFCFHQSVSVKIASFVPVMDLYMLQTPYFTQGQYSRVPHLRSYGHTLEMVSLPKGYLYLFHKGKLWRELFINGRNKMQDTDLDHYRSLVAVGGKTGEGRATANGFMPDTASGKDARDERKPAGVELEEILIFEKEAGKYKILFSEEQLSWARILWYERNPDGLNRRAQPLEFFSMKKVPACHPRDPEREWLHQNPEQVARDLSGDLLEKELAIAAAQRKDYWETPGCDAGLQESPEKNEIQDLMGLFAGAEDLNSRPVGAVLGAANMVCEWKILEETVSRASRSGKDFSEEEKKMIAQVQDVGKAWSGIFAKKSEKSALLFGEEQKKRKVQVVPVHAPWYTLRFYATQAKIWANLGTVMGCNAMLEKNDYAESASILYASLCVPKTNRALSRLAKRLDPAKMHKALRHSPRVAAQIRAHLARKKFLWFLSYQGQRVLEAFYDLSSLNGYKVLTGTAIWNNFIEALNTNFHQDPLLCLVEPWLAEKRKKLFGLAENVVAFVEDAWEDASGYPLNRPIVGPVPLKENDGSGKGRFSLLCGLAEVQKVAVNDLSRDLQAIAELAHGEKDKSLDYFSAGSVLVYHSIGHFFETAMKEVTRLLGDEKGGLQDAALVFRRSKILNLGRTGPVTRMLSFQVGAPEIVGAKGRAPMQVAIFSVTGLFKNAEAKPLSRFDNKGPVRFQYEDGRSPKTLTVDFKNVHGKRLYAVVPQDSDMAHFLGKWSGESGQASLKTHMAVSFIFMPIQAFNITRALTDPSIKNAFDAASNLTDFIQGLHHTRTFLQASSLRISEKLLRIFPRVGLSASTMAFLGPIGNICSSAVFLISGLEAKKNDNIEAANAHFLATGLAFISVAFGGFALLARFFTGIIGVILASGTPISIIFIVLAIGIFIWALFIEEDDTPLRRCIIHGPLGKHGTYDAYKWLENRERFYYQLLSALYPVFIHCAPVDRMWDYEENKQTALFKITDAERTRFLDMPQDHYIVSIYAPLLSVLHASHDLLEVNVEERIRRKYKKTHLFKGTGGASVTYTSEEKTTSKKTVGNRFLHQAPGTGVFRYRVLTDYVPDNVKIENSTYGPNTTTTRQTLKVFLRIIPAKGSPGYFPAPEVTKEEPKILNNLWYTYNTRTGKNGVLKVGQGKSYTKVTLPLDFKLLYA